MSYAFKYNYNNYLFKKYQSFLLKIINNPIGKWFLRVPNTKENKGKEILEVFPNAIKYPANKKGNLYYDFYVNQRLAQRISIVLEVIEVFSFADYLKTFRYFGLATALFILVFGIPIHNLFPIIYGSTNFNPATGEGNVNTGSHTSWANAKADTTGTTGSTPAIYSWKAGASDFYIIRTHEPFDTSSLSDTANVISSVFKFYRDDSLDSFFNADTVTLHVVPSTETDPTAIAGADLDNFTFSSKGSLAFASTSNGSYNNITVNTDQVSLTGYSKLGLIDSNDLNNTEPTGRNTLVWQARGGANPAIFTVEIGSNSASISPSPSQSPSSSASSSQSPSASQSPSGSASASLSPSGSVSPSASESASLSLSGSPSSSTSRSSSSSSSSSTSPSASQSPSGSESKSQSPSSSLSPSISQSSSESSSASASASKSSSQSTSPSASISQSQSVSASPSPAQYTDKYSAVGNTYIDKYF